jgi:RNA polymerase sigma-70 factor (ECF subfamily)
MHDTFVAELLPHLSTLRRVAARYGGDADDLVQETWLRALRARETYRLGSNAAGWLRRILTNLAVTEHRRRRRAGRLVDRLAVEPSLDPGDAANDDGPALPGDGAVLRALASLDERDRRVIELCDLDELRYRDAARVLECPIGTIMSRLHRARRRLREALARELAVTSPEPLAA